MSTGAPDHDEHEAPRQEVSGIDLCLSGGGYRATLFHLGVVLYLRARGKLHLIKRIYAVSGGAILAADLVNRWPLYLPNSETDFGNSLRLLIDPITRKSFRDRVIAYWAYSRLVPLFVILIGYAMIPTALGISALLLGFVVLVISLIYFGLNFWAHALFRRWFRFVTLWRCIPNDRPSLFLLATDLLTGRLAEFSTEGFRLYPDTVSTAGIHEQNKPLSFAVSASAAFPPLFPPQTISNDDESAVLTDGGVFDNLGVCARQARGPSPGPKTLWLVSDAGCDFVPRREGFGFRSVALRNARATDIVMNRLAEKDLELQNPSALRTVSIRETQLTTIALPTAVRRLVPRIRTDLNRFTKKEVLSLVLHGLDAAEHVNQVDLGAISDEERKNILAVLQIALRLPKTLVISEPPNCPDTSSLSVSHEHLASSDRRSFWKQWHLALACLVLLFAGLHILGGIPSFLYGLGYNAFFGAPEFACQRDNHAKAVMNSEIQADQFLRVAFANHLQGTKENQLYESSIIAGPLFDSELRLAFASDVLLGTEELVQGEDFFAVLVPTAEAPAYRFPLNTKVIQTQDPNERTVVIELPRFKGTARIWLSTATSKQVEFNARWIPKEQSK